MTYEKYETWLLLRMLNMMTSEYDDIRVFFFLFFYLNNVTTITNHIIFILTCLCDKL